jgi:hypothetical protein
MTLPSRCDAFLGKDEGEGQMSEHDLDCTNLASLDGLFGLRVISKTCRQCKRNVGVLTPVYWPNAGLRLDARCVNCGERLTMLCRADQLDLIRELRKQRRVSAEPIRKSGRTHAGPLSTMP